MSRLTTEKYKHHKLQSFEYEGVYFTDGLFTKSRLDEMKTFEVRDGDIYIVTYPKAGRYCDITLKLRK